MSVQKSVRKIEGGEDKLSLTVTKRRPEVCFKMGSFKSAIKIIFIPCIIYSAFSPLSHRVASCAETIPASANNQNNGNKILKLDCQPGEQRQFKYESSTKIWGPSNQQVRLESNLRIKCMEPAANGTLKYMAEIIELIPKFESKTPSQSESSISNNGKSSSQTLVTQSARQARKFVDLHAKHPTAPLIVNDDEMVARAEPLLEEVGEAISATASRMKRSVSGWFSKTWSSVRDFFGNIFSSSERVSISREQAAKESGLDLGYGHCKASSGKAPSARLPIDDSVFDDLGPEYYIGASLDPAGTSNPQYDFQDDQPVSSESGNSVDSPEDEYLSFFDDPRPKQRSKRATGGSKGTRSAAQQQQHQGERVSFDFVNENYEKLLKLPFVILQSPNGKILEIRFSNDETEVSVKNFKRHLCDLFATNLDASQKIANEVSPIGKHQTSYTLDSSAAALHNKSGLSSEADKQTTAAAAKQLVRVLALVGQQAGGGGGGSLLPSEASSTSGREPIVGSNQGDQQMGVSVLRSISTTGNVRVATKTLLPDIDQMQIRVKQVQRITDGRLIGTAGQLSMSLVATAVDNDSKKSTDGAASVRRARRATMQSGEQVEDMADMLQVSTSFSMQIVPVAYRPDGTIDDSVDAGDSSEKGTRRTRRSTANTSNEGTIKPSGRRRPLVSAAPLDAQELARTLQDWRKAEARLQLSASSVIAENSGPLENQRQRLEILRDQIKMRLNEEYLRNRMRRSIESREMAVAGGGPRDEKGQGGKGGAGQGTDLVGLSLTQIILGNGITTKRKGSIYSIIEEAMELEKSLSDQLGSASTVANGGENQQEPLSISNLLRDTIRMDKLSAYCKSSILSLDELRDHNSSRSSGAKINEFKPFGVTDDHGDHGHGGKEKRNNDSSLFRTNEAIKLLKINEHKLNQCKQVLHLMVRLSKRQAADLTLDLVDECNKRLLAAAKLEELGYGPLGKYYRNLRQQFVELLANFGRPTDQLLDKLVGRLYYAKLISNANDKKQIEIAATSARRRKQQEEAEFVYVPAGIGSESDGRQKPYGGGGGGNTGGYNKTILKEEDDFNNNDGAASLVMTLTTLASKRSISRVKRVEVVEKLLNTLSSTSCSLFDGPDFDILESMANFQMPQEEIVVRLVQLARRCRASEQYTIACVHGLAGQLQHSSLAQRFFAEQLRSPNATCSLKSEILFTLLGVQQINDLTINHSALINLKSHQAAFPQPPEPWPSNGLNQLDETLLDILVASNSTEEKRRNRLTNRRCIKKLVQYYMSKKHDLANLLNGNQDISKKLNALFDGETSLRYKRAPKQEGDYNSNRIKREEQFWDQAQCKRWSLPANATFADVEGIYSSRNATSFDKMAGPVDLVDELDDNSLLNAILLSQTNKTSRSLRRQKQMGLRIADSERSSQTNNSILLALTNRDASDNGNSSSSQPQTSNAAPLRKRHKCSASKTFGPRNAQASVSAEIVNDLIGAKDENKFLARFRLTTNFLGNQIDVGRMYLWHQRQTTRAHANILGRSIWDTSHKCNDKAPNQMLYMPLFDFNLWLLKVSVGLRLQAEMGFFSGCQSLADKSTSGNQPAARVTSERLQIQPVAGSVMDELELFPTISLRASGEAMAKFVVAKAGMSLASQYGYQGNIRVSRQPDSCMSVRSAHQPMNVTFSSWFQLWDSDCHFWGSRGRAEPQATKWRLDARSPSVWLDNECMNGVGGAKSI